MRAISKLLLIVVLFFSNYSFLTAQNEPWTKKDDSQFILDTEILNQKLKNLIRDRTAAEIVFPNMEGNLKSFRIYDNPVLPPQLAKKYPAVHSFKGHEVGNPNKIIRFTCNANGLEATLLSGSKIVNLTNIEQNIYALKSALSAPVRDNDFECLSLKTEDAILKETPKRSEKLVRSPNVERVVRLAIATTGEVSDFFVNKNGLQSATDNQKKAAVLAGISASVNNVNVVFEKDLGVRFSLIENNDALIFLNKNTDPFDEIGDINLLINQGRITIEDTIPYDDYDMGHLIALSVNGGLASPGGVCSDLKGDAITGFRQPEGFFFDFTLFAHELGHQLGGTHTQSASCQTEDPVEVGSGTTIMGYSGACGIDNVQPESDAHFHSQSIEQIFERLESLDARCGIQNISLSNSLPELPELRNYTVPVGLPLYFDAKATDADGDNLTYSWEQYDQDFGPSPPRADSNFGPQFRVYPPISQSRRNFPTAGVNNMWEVLPLGERTMDFRLLVRDGNTGGVVISDIVQLSLIDTDETFQITTPTASTNISQGQDINVQWDVAGTDAPPFNVSNVKIEYSFDGGVTYPVVLAESVPNGGSATVTFPMELDLENEVLNNGKIRISALENAFYTFSEDALTLNTFPSTSLIAVQDLRTNLSIFKIRTSFEVAEDLVIDFSFQDTTTQQDLDFSSELLVSSDLGDNFSPLLTNNIVIPAGAQEVWLALPLRELTDTTISEVILNLFIPDGSSNTNVSTTTTIVKKRLSISENISFNNPSDGRVTFTAQQRQLEDYSIQLFSISGALIRQFSFGANEQTFSLNGLSTGLYIVRISISGESVAEKLVVF